MLMLTIAALVAADASQKYAFVAGVNEYQRRGFETLRFPENDAKELAEALRKLDFQVVELVGAAATKSALEAKLDAMLKSATKNDVILVFLAGHGLQLPVKRPDGTTKEDGFFCPYDATRSEPDTLFSLSKLTDEILGKRGGKNLVLLDACRDTPDDPNRSARGVQGRVVSLPEDTAILFSCRAGQRSWESDKLGAGHGLFTHAVLEGLSGKAAAKGEVTWQRLAAHVVGALASDDYARLRPAGIRQDALLAGQTGHISLGSVAATGGQPRAPEYDAFATGQWLKRFDKPAEAALKPRAKFVGEALELNNQFLDVKDFQAKDMIVRARAIKPDQRRSCWIMLTVRQSASANYLAGFDGDNEFWIGKTVNGKFSELRKGRSPENFPGYFNFAFAVVGNKLSLYADGRLVVEARDDSVTQPGAAQLVGFKGVGRFKNVEVQSLDAPQAGGISVPTPPGLQPMR